MTSSPSVARYVAAIPPRLNISPATAVANSARDVIDLTSTFGLFLDDWQQVILECALGERRDGRWASPRVGYSVPRQNGKSKLLLARAIAGALLFGEKKIIISAHLQDTAREIFNEFVALHDENPALQRKVKSIMSAINREYIKFHNGAIIQFKARTGAGGRGFSCDCLLLDEAQKLTRAAWVSINSTMSARPNPQVWLLGTVPTPEDDSEVFAGFRESVIEGKEPLGAWIEWGAEAGDDPELEETRRKANPAWDIRINHEVVQSEFVSYTESEFAIDRLGIWPDKHDIGSRLITHEQWTDTAVDEPLATGIKAFGVTYSKTGDRVSIAGAMHTPERTHTELVGKHSGSTEEGVAALAEWLIARKSTIAVVAIAGRSDAETLRERLRKGGMRPKQVKVVNTTEYFAACSMVIDAIRDRTLTHLAHEGQTELDESVAVSDKKVRSKDGAWGWIATTADGDETPVEAMSLAVWAARTTTRDPAKRTKGRVL